MAAVAVIPKTDNINVLTDLVDIALKVHAEFSKIIARRAITEKWVLHPHGFIVRTKLHELAKKLVGEEELATGYQLTREIIYCLPGYGDLREEIEVDKANYSFDHSGDPDQYTYSKFVKEVCPDIIPEVSLEGFKDLCQALNKVVTISESGKQGAPYDYSYIERPAIGDHEANFREGIFNSLVEGIRDAGLKDTRE